MPRCQASVIQRKHLAQFEVNCHKTVLEISKKGPGKSLKSPWIFYVEKCMNPGESKSKLELFYRLFIERFRHINFFFALAF